MESQTSFRQYTRAIRKRWWLLALLAIIAVTGVYFRFGSAAPSYVATATVMVSSMPFDRPAAAEIAPGVIDTFRPSPATVMTDLIELLGTRAVAERVARRLGIENVRLVQQSVSGSVPNRTTSLLRISAATTDPQTAAAMANTAAEELSNYFRETNSANAREARRFIERQLADVRARLDASDAAILAARRNLATVEGASGAIVGAYYSSLSALDDARNALRETEARLAASQARIGREAPTLVSETAVLENPVYRQIQARLVDLQVERSQLAAVYTPAHPRMRQLEGQIASLHERLAAESRTEVGREVRTANPIHASLLSSIVSLQVERAAAQARIAALAATVRSRRGAVAGLPGDQLRVARLARENEILDASYRALSEQHQQAILRENVAGFFPAGIQLVAAATAPERPRPSGVPRTAAAAGLAGIVLGIVAALFLEATDEAIRTPEEVERTLGVPVLAEVPNANEPRVTPANAMFMAGFLILLGVSLLGAFVRTPFAPINVAGAVMRATVITPLQSGLAQVSDWFQPDQTQGAVSSGE